MKVKVGKPVMQLRREGYDSKEEQIGALWKIVEALMEGKDPPEDALAIMGRVKAVKEKYPKKKAP